MHGAGLQTHRTVPGAAHARRLRAVLLSNAEAGRVCGCAKKDDSQKAAHAGASRLLISRPTHMTSGQLFTSDSLLCFNEITSSWLDSCCKSFIATFAPQLELWLRSPGKIWALCSRTHRCTCRIGVRVRANCGPLCWHIDPRATASRLLRSAPPGGCVSCVHPIFKTECPPSRGLDPLLRQHSVPSRPST